MCFALLAAMAPRCWHCGSAKALHAICLSVPVVQAQLCMHSDEGAMALMGSLCSSACCVVMKGKDRVKHKASHGMGALQLWQLQERGPVAGTHHISVCKPPRSSHANGCFNGSAAMPRCHISKAASRKLPSTH